MTNHSRLYGMLLGPRNHGHHRTQQGGGGHRQGENARMDSMGHVARSSPALDTGHPQQNICPAKLDLELHNIRLLSTPDNLCLQSKGHKGQRTIRSRSPLGRQPSAKYPTTDSRSATIVPIFYVWTHIHNANAIFFRRFALW